MLINGVEIDLDLMDADTVEKFENGCRKVMDKIGDMKQYEGKSNADCFRYQCGVINEFFDHLCGPGTSDSLFKGKSNVEKSTEALAAVVAEFHSSSRRINDIQNKYLSGIVPSASPNRAARRDKKHRKANAQTPEFHGRP